MVTDAQLDTAAAQLAGRLNSLLDMLDEIPAREPVEHWWPLASCLGVDWKIFWPELISDFDERDDARKQAKKICASCPVAQECLDFGIREPFGIWGGMTAIERRHLRAQLANERRNG